MAEGYDENLVTADQGAAEQNADPRDTNAESQPADPAAQEQSNQVESGQEVERKHQGAPPDVLAILNKIHDDHGLNKGQQAIPDDQQQGQAPAGPQVTEQPGGTTFSSGQAIPESQDDTNAPASPYGQPTATARAGEQSASAAGAGADAGSTGGGLGGAVSGAWDSIKKMLMGDGAETPLKRKQDEERVMRDAAQIDAGRQNRPGIWTKDEVMLEALRRAQRESDAAAAAKMQGYRDEHTTWRGIGEAALDHGDRDAAARAFDRAHQNVADGKTVTTVPAPGGQGGFLVTVRSPSNDPDTIGTVANETAKSYRLTDNQMRDMMHGPAGQFDVLHFHGIEKSLEGAMSKPGLPPPAQPPGQQGGAQPGTPAPQGGAQPGGGVISPAQGQSRPYGINKPSSTDQAREDVRANRAPLQEPSEQLMPSTAQGGRGNYPTTQSAGQPAGGQPAPAQQNPFTQAMQNMQPDDPRRQRFAEQARSWDAAHQGPGMTTDSVRQRVNEGAPNIPAPGHSDVSPEQQKIENAARGGATITQPATQATGAAPGENDPHEVAGRRAYPNDPESAKQYAKLLRDRDRAEEAHRAPAPAEKPKSRRVQNAEYQDQQEEERRVAHERATQKQQQREQQAAQTGSTRRQSTLKRGATAPRKVIGYRDKMTGQINYTQ